MAEQSDGCSDQTLLAFCVIPIVIHHVRFSNNPSFGVHVNVRIAYDDASNRAATVQVKTMSTSSL